MNRRRYFVIFLISAAATLFAVFISLRILERTKKFVAENRDEHGCITSAGYEWCDQKQKCLKPFEETCVNSDEMISDLIDIFYKSYESCMKNPPSEASGKVGEYCQNNSGLTTDSFASNLEMGGTAKAGADPVVCAQNFPENIKVSSDIQYNGNRATGFVEEKFGSSTVKPKIEILDENGVWKIDNIVCPL